MQWNNDPADDQQGGGQPASAGAAGSGQAFPLPGPDAFPFGLDFSEEGHLALLDTFGGDPGGSDMRAKRQRMETGEASVDAYMAHLAAAPQMQHAQSGELDPGSATGGSAAVGSGGPALRSRSIAYEDDLEDESAGAPGGGGGSRGRGGTVANPSKAHRERARRERLNDGFAELAQLLDAGKAVRTDKLSIIADAVKEVTKLRAESHQLRQLNKFLEERVKDLETAKHQAELARMMQAQLGSQGAGGGGGAGAGGASAAGAASGGMQAQFMQQGFGQAFVPGLGMAGGMVAIPAAALQQLTMGGQLLQGGQSVVSTPMAQSVSHISAGAALLQQAQAEAQQQAQGQGQQAQNQHGYGVAALPDDGGAAHAQPQQQLQPTAAQQQQQQQQYPQQQAASPQPAPPQQQQQQQQTQQQNQQQQPQQQSQPPQQMAFQLPGMTEVGFPGLQYMQQAHLVGSMPPGSAGVRPEDMAAAHSAALASASFQLPVLPGGGGSAQVQQAGASGDGGQAASMPPNPLWLAPGALDTSQDHVRRPPAA